MFSLVCQALVIFMQVFHYELWTVKYKERKEKNGENKDKHEC